MAQPGSSHSHEVANLYKNGFVRQAVIQVVLSWKIFTKIKSSTDGKQ